MESDIAQTFARQATGIDSTGACLQMMVLLLFSLAIMMYLACGGTLCTPMTALN